MGVTVEKEKKFHRADEVLDRPYDDLVEGEWFASRRRTITETDVVNFAALTGDWHQAHTDQVWAEQNIFGARVAHGLLIMSYAVGLVPNSYVLALRRVKNVVYKNPVRFGDTIQVQGIVAKLQPFSDDVGMVVGRWKIVNQHDVTCLKMELEALWGREPIT
jgi:3-hydroxybutyryl-CoA dehydratase